MRGMGWIGYRMVVFAVVLLLIISPDSIRARSAKHKEEPPLWRLQISQLAHVSIPFSLCVYCLQVDYIDNSTLAVTLLTTDMSPSALKRGSSGVSSPYKYRTTFLDANSGHVRATHDWQSPTMYFHVTPTYDGKFVVETFGEIALYSNEFAELKRLKFAEPGFLSTGFSRASVSWDGKTLCIAKAHGNEMMVKLLDADTFAEISSWSTTLPSPMWFVAASDDGVAVAVDNKASVVSVGQPWRTIFATSAGPLLSVLSANFANNDLLLMTRGNRVTGVSSDGTQLFQTELSPQQMSLSTRGSRNGRAFVVQTDEFLLAYQGQFALPASLASTPVEIAVYDSSNGRAIFHRAVPTANGRPYDDIAISPDANHLAVLSGGLRNRSDGVVEVFRLPHVDGVN